MHFTIEKVYERDIDLLIINNLMNGSLLNLIVNELNVPSDYYISDVYHSLSNELGESDVVAVLTNKTHKIAILIENKIDAVAQPCQSERYNARGNYAVENGEYDEFRVVIFAPEDYLETNVEAQKYPFRISYEKLQRQFDDNSFEWQIINQAIIKKKNGYSPIESKEVTLFWEQLNNYVVANYPKLSMSYTDGPKGSSSCWPIFKLPIPNTCIRLKANKKCVDLELTGMLDQYQRIISANTFLEDIDDVSVVATGKSLAIRKMISKEIIFSDSFDVQKDVVDEALNVITQLVEISKKIEL